MEKWPAKALSLAAAIIISVFHRMNTLETRVFTAPVQVMANEFFVPASSFANTVRISLRGEAADISAILEDDIAVFIDLSKFASEGARGVPVHFEKKGSALGVEPLEISILPMEINILLERKTRRDIPVFPAFHGSVAPGFEITAQSVIPENITVEGPRSNIEKYSEINTEVIDLEGRHGEISIFARLINNDPLVTIFGNRMIEYHATISRIIIEPIHEPEDLLIDVDDGEDWQW